MRNSYVDNINQQNFYVSGKDMVNRDEMMAGTIDEMFANLNTHLLDMDDMKEQYEKLKRDGNG